MVPEGESDAARVTIGQFHGTPVVVEVWRKGKDKVVVRVVGKMTTTEIGCSPENDEIDIPVTLKYRQLSERKGLTNSKTEVILPFPLLLLPHLLPEGSEYGAKLPIGRSGGQEREVTVYREGRQVVVEDKLSGRYKVAFTDQQEEVEVTLQSEFPLTLP